MHFTWPSLPEDCNKFVFDTNVLIYMHGFQINLKYARRYAPVIEHIVSSKSVVYIDKIVLSEFINRYVNSSMDYKLRLQGKLAKDEKFRFNKNIHRNTPEYKRVLQEVKSILFQLCTTYNIEFHNENFYIDSEHITNCLNDMEFNDYLIMSLAKDVGATIVTNDRDLIGCEEVNTLSA